MATDKSKFMIFQEGPEDGEEIKWAIPDEPPPKTHSVRANGELHLYKRKKIHPFDNHIDYIYIHNEKGQ